MQLFYNFSISLYGLIIRIVALFNEKARKWVDGRKDLLSTIPNNINGDIVINWFHCASLGEFEQGRPLIEKFKSDFPNEKILLTFYSPSGYEIRKNYELADYVTYLPLDLKSKMQPFIDKVNAKRVFIIKYELWFNMLSLFAEKKTPTYLISGKFRKEQIFFKPHGSWFLTRLRNSFTHFFVQDEASHDILLKNGISNSSVVGDTRIDRVVALAKSPMVFPYLQSLVKGKQVIIAGSTWQKENEFLQKIKNKLAKDVVLIIAPHDIKEKNITSLVSAFPEAVLWSNIESCTSAPQVIIVNCIGILSSLYQYAHLAIIGGGFGSGIHNILEPACFGLPVMFGPKHQKFEEAAAMIKIGSGFSFLNYQDFERILLSLIDNQERRTQIATKQQTYLSKQSGATNAIISSL